MKALQYSRLALCVLFAVVMVSKAAALESDEWTRNDLARVKLTPHIILPPQIPPPQRFGEAHASQGLPYYDTVPNWIDHYFADGFDADGNPNQEWYTDTVGNPPWQGGTTLINVAIVPVIVDLRNDDGSPRFVNGQPLISSPETFVDPILKSPVFAYSNWSSSSVPTQLIDAIQRASYFSKAKDDWHTILVPSVKPARRMVLNKGSYLFALNDDGSCCLAVAVYPQAAFGAMGLPVFSSNDTTTIMGAAAAAGDITTNDITVLLFNNTLVLDFAGIPAVPGFHTYGFVPEDKAYVMAFVSWISPGIFPSLPPGTIEDVTPLSHELAEIMNNPITFNPFIIQNITPWWLGPKPNDNVCGHQLEVGDPVALLPNSVYPITMNGMTYHPQNVVLVPWFKRESPSSALHNAYTYPDESLMTDLSPFLDANCLSPPIPSR
jgi:hypothetical protein